MTAASAKSSSGALAEIHLEKNKGAASDAIIDARRKRLRRKSNAISVGKMKTGPSASLYAQRRKAPRTP